MSARDICVCGHYRSEHITAGGRCVIDLSGMPSCGCSQFNLGGTEARDKSADWVRLAALALLVERGQATLDFKTHAENTITARQPPNDSQFLARVEALQYTRSVARAIILDSDTNAPAVGISCYHATIETRQDIDSTEIDPAAVAESMSVMWAERAIALGVDSRKTPAECTSKNECTVCGSPPGHWCRAAHAGERDAGGWTHPERERDVRLTQAHLRHLAFAIRDANLYNEGAAVNRLVEAVLAVPYYGAREDEDIVDWNGTVAVRVD